jgi:poly-gamma-glutamate synthesis protein (capsule biosynthesis protein)
MAPDEHTTAPPPVRRSATLAFTGDTLAHSPLWRGAAANAGGTGFDFRPMFADIAPRISAADLAVCHLETPIAPADEDYSTDPLYGVPAEVVVGIASAGYDRCSTASNHALDRRAAGVDRTVEVLEFNGISQSGMARTPEEIEPRVFDVNGITMSHLSYTYATNGIPSPPGEPWRTRLLDPDVILDDARQARNLGADFVVLSLHWGEEREATPSREQVDIAERLTASGLVDLIVGHHTHVLQPIEQINGVWVAYGLGNILSNLPVTDYWPDSTQDAAIVEFEVTMLGDDVTVDRPNVRPTWVDKNNGWVIRDVANELSDPLLAESTRAELNNSLTRTAAVLGDFIG